MLRGAREQRSHAESGDLSRYDSHNIKYFEPMITVSDWFLYL